MSKKQELEKLKKEMDEDESLPLQESNLVFGEGDSESEVLFIGEAPGYHEDKQRRPFVGRSGQLLTDFIEDIDWNREDVYITNIVKRRPPDNRDPEPEEIKVYKPYLAKQIRIIDPKVIVPLGRFAMNYFIPNRMISKTQGSIFWMKDKVIMPIYHPAAALRSTNVKEDTQNSFYKLKKVVEEFDDLIEKRNNKTKKQKEDSEINKENRLV